MIISSLDGMYSAFFRKARAKISGNSFYAQLCEYLGSKEIYTANAMREYIESKKPLYSFECREDLAFELAEIFFDKKIPYVLTSSDNKLKFLVRATDCDKIKDLSRSLREEKANSCTILDYQDFEKVALRYGGDKSVLILSNLSRQEAEFLRKNLGKIDKKSVISLEKHDDSSYSVGIIAERFVKMLDNREDFFDVYTQMVLNFCGQNSARIASELTREINYNEGLAQNFELEGVNLDRTPCFIIGKTKRYIKVTNMCFEVGFAKVYDGEVELVPYEEVKYNDQNYTAKLMAYGDSIPYRYITYDYDVVERHFLKDGGVDIADLKPSGERQSKLLGERIFASKLSESVKLVVSESNLSTTKRNYDLKLNLYSKTCAELLSLVKIGRGNNKFPRETIYDLLNVLDSYDLSIDDYEEAIEKFRTPEIVVIAGEKIQAKAVNIEQLQEKIREEQKAKAKELERSKSKSKKRENREIELEEGEIER